MIEFLAGIMGQVMDIIFKATVFLHAPSIVLSIVLFTAIMNALLTPIVYNQQKFRLAASQMQPILTAIAEKYKGRDDSESTFSMNREIKDIYASYHVKTSMGFLPILIQIPLIFAIYGVVADIERYVPVLQTGLYDSCYSFLGLPLSESPLSLFQTNTPFSMVWLKATILPGLVFFSQFLPIKSVQPNKKKTNIQRFVITNTVFGALFSFLCMRLPVGLGIYWITGTLICFVRQLCLNRKLKQDLVLFNEETKRREILATQE